MAQYIDYENYNDMISALTTFITQVSEACDEMESAGNECVENMDGDQASTKANAKLGSCIVKYRETLEAAQNLINAMQEEMEAAQNAAAKIDDLD